jgi:hypothetical protein
MSLALLAVAAAPAPDPAAPTSQGTPEELYVGGSRFINATTYETPTVREDDLDDPHWSAIYQGGRRPR